MKFWRLLAYGLFFVAVILSIISLTKANFSLFLVALACYFLSTLILVTIKKLYKEPFRPNTKNYRQRDNVFRDLLEELVNILDIIIEFPAVLFRIFLKFF